MKKQILLLAACALLLTVGCEKDPKPTPDANDGRYAYVLNEGMWGGNNAEISRINITDGTIEANWFSQANGRGLGDLGQDLIHYGSRLYAVVNNSNTVEVIDPATGRSVKQISMGTRGPRYVAAHKGKLYVTCYDKTVVRIDTATLAIEATCPLSGMQPEQLCVLQDKLYICNAWQYDENGTAVYDNTLSVVDLASFTEVDKITVGTNPGRIKALPGGRLLVACTGDYYLEPATTLVLDLNTGNQTALTQAATNMDISGNDIYFYSTAYDANWNPTANFFHMNHTDLQPTPILEQLGSTLSNAYGINYDATSGKLFICNSPYDAAADVYCFDKEGNQLFCLEAGSLASKVVL